MSDDSEKIDLPADSFVEAVPVDAEPEDTTTAVASQKLGSNEYFHDMVDRNFLEYAAYAIKDRAIPNVDDGLKPVQRRILWAMHRVDENRTNKASFVVGEVMGKYHPHGDASIKDALVVLANKEYFIEKQGNFGNILTGSPAAAPRYIECGLTPMAREVLYNDDITELVDTYDGRNMEPVVLPVKIPALLMLGSHGIAVGMATQIMPHNFNELLKAQIAVLNGERFELYPDFLQGGLMDVRKYDDGNGKLTLRARIDIVDRKLVIREIPATTTTESLIASIEKAAERNKIKISSVNDYTAKEVEIEVVPTRGYDVEKALQALYMYTDCAVTISPNLTVIRDFRPTVMSVSEVIVRNTEKLLEYLRRELEIALNKQSELFHAKTLAQIFFENRIYKKIEDCRDEASEYQEVRAGLAPFRYMLKRDVTDADIDKLLALPVRRIARFDIEKNQRELREIETKIAELLKHMRHLKRYAINYLENLLKKYGAFFPRRTEIETFDKIDRKSAALNNIKIGWDRRNGYIGTGIKSDDTITCNEFDLLLELEKTGKYHITSLPPEKIFVGKLYDCRKYDPAQEFGVIYRDNASGKCYGKRTVIGSFIKDREYMLCPEGCKLELFTPRADAIYILTAGARKETVELNLLTLPVRSAKARGVLVDSKNITKITHSRYLTAEEAEALRSQAVADEETDDAESDEVETVESAEPEESADAMPVHLRKLYKASRVNEEIRLANEIADHISASLDTAPTEMPPQVTEEVTPSEPAKVVEPEQAPEPEKPVEPVKAPEPEKPVEPVKAPEPEKPVEPVNAPEPEKPVEPVKAPELEKPVEPVNAPEPEKPVEPAKAPEPKVVDEAPEVTDDGKVTEPEDDGIPPFEPDLVDVPQVPRPPRPPKPRRPKKPEPVFPRKMPGEVTDAKPSEPDKVPDESGKKNDDDELGIMQPEFGF